jgi:hypothetical protein
MSRNWNFKPQKRKVLHPKFPEPIHIWLNPNPRREVDYGICPQCKHVSPFCKAILWESNLDGSQGNGMEPKDQNLQSKILCGFG